MLPLGTSNKTKNAAKSKSAEKIVAALLALMRDKPYETVSVTEICSAAGVGRKTFYRNFDGKDGIIAYRLDCIFAALAAHFDFAVAESSKVIEFCYAYLNEHRETDVLFLDAAVVPFVVEKIVEYIETAYDGTLYNSASFEPSLAEYYHTFIADGLVSLICTWIENNYRQSVKSMSALSKRLLSGVLS